MNRENVKHWIEVLYGPFFKVIGFFYRTFKANRDRVTRLKKNTRLGEVFKGVMILTLVVWILIWLFASEESRNRLTEEVKQSLEKYQLGNENQAGQQ